MSKKSFSRRNFIKSSAASAFSVTFIPAYLTAAKSESNPMLPPSQRINLAVIGSGGMGRGTAKKTLSNGLAIPVAFCDVDFVENPKKKRQTNLAYEFPDLPRFDDFRKLFDEMSGDIDAVSINTPDHTHFTATILAMSHGKHVYTQKPLTFTFEESEILMRAEKKFGVVTQMGNQGHTSGGAEQFKNMLQHGLLDNIDYIEAYRKSSLWWMNPESRITQYPQPSKPPETLHWDLWIGPREFMPYRDMFHPFDWRGWYEFGLGMFGDWGAHIIDFAHHYLNLGLPTEIKPIKLYDHNAYSYPRGSHIQFKFPERGPRFPAVTLDWKEGDDFAIPEADSRYGDQQKDGTIRVPRLKGAGTFLHRQQKDYIVQRGSHSSPSRLYPTQLMQDYKDIIKAPAVEDGHEISFVKACMDRSLKTESPFSVAGVLTQTLIIGAIAERLNRDLKFDPIKKQFINDEQANALLNLAPRAEWADFYKMA
jgi:predicted dehydrogenase